MDKRLLAKQLFQKAREIHYLNTDISNMLDEVVTPGSELHLLLIEVAQHKIGDSQKIKTAGMNNLPDDDDTSMTLLKKLEEFGFVVEFYDDGDHRIDLLRFRIPEKEEATTLYQLELENM